MMPHSMRMVVVLPEPFGPEKGEHLALLDCRATAVDGRPARR